MRRLLLAVLLVLVCAPAFAQQQPPSASNTSDMRLWGKNATGVWVPVVLDGSGNLPTSSTGGDPGTAQQPAPSASSTVDARLWAKNLSGVYVPVVLDANGKLPTTGGGASGALTAPVTVTGDGIGVTSTDGLVITNTTAAALGAQQWAPRLRLRGNGYASTSTASQPVDWILENRPIQFTSAPYSNFVIANAINGGAYTEWLNIDTIQFTITSPATFTSSGAAAFSASTNTAYYGWRSNNTKLYSDASNQLDLRSSTTAQRVNIANTFTSASVREDLSLYNASNVGHIGMTQTGATARVLQLDYGGTTTAAVSVPITSGPVAFGGAVKTLAGAFSTLPTCNSGTEGALQGVTDSNIATWGSTVAAGGSNHVLAYCNGTNWTVAAK